VKLGYRSSHTTAIDSVPAGARVLDIGCGPGLVAAELARKGCIVDGADQWAPRTCDPGTTARRPLRVVGVRY
jgi:2-polyprenyl-3-methyl-5-hydroxy-6-metoxy-1,4-benzoquinol methylase